MTMDTLLIIARAALRHVTQFVQATKVAKKDAAHLCFALSARPRTRISKVRSVLLAILLIPAVLRQRASVLLVAVACDENDDGAVECDSLETSSASRQKSRWFGLADTLLLEGALAEEVYCCAYGTSRGTWYKISVDLVAELSRRQVRTNFKVGGGGDDSRAGAERRRSCRAFLLDLAGSRPLAPARTAMHTSSSSFAPSMRNHFVGPERRRTTRRKCSS
jgi:hypothetical protein